jgi:hypothetical protein
MEAKPTPGLYQVTSGRHAGDVIRVIKVTKAQAEIRTVRGFGSNRGRHFIQIPLLRVTCQRIGG